MEKQQYEMQTLNEEKQLLEKEYKRIPDPVVSLSYIQINICNCLHMAVQEEAKKLQELQTDCNDLRDETERRAHEIGSIRDEIEQKGAVIKDIQIEVVSYIKFVTPSHFRSKGILVLQILCTTVIHSCGMSSCLTTR